MDEYLNKTIHQSQRNCERIDQFVCCPQDVQLEQEAIVPITFKGPTTAKLNPPECGKTKVLDANRVIGGSNAPEGAWPWMALYGKGTSANPRFTCGGSIITKRHVLTAAHCLLEGTSKFVYFTGTFVTVLSLIFFISSFVRLGLHDIKKNDPNVVDIRVANSTSHEDYDDGDKHSDIAILLLIEEIVFSMMIAPICLPLDEPLRSEKYLNTNPYIAGWGKISKNVHKCCG